MTESEFRIRLKGLEAEFNNNRKTLLRDFAFSNNPYVIGDIIEDEYGIIIKIDKILYREVLGELIPSECSYVGTKLKKDLTPYKKDIAEKIYQSKIINKLVKK